MSVIMTMLFFVMTPGMLVSLPSGCDATIVTAFHACLFTIMWFVITGPVLDIVTGPVAGVFSDKPKMAPPQKKVVAVKKAHKKSKNVEGMVV